MSLPPEAWAPARSFALRLVRPVERFLHVQAASGVVLLVMAVAALAWANSPHLLYGRIVCARTPLEEGAAATEHEAEISTEA